MASMVPAVLDVAQRIAISFRAVKVNREALKAIREKDGLSQLALAEAADTSQGYLSQLERGERDTVRPALAKKLAQALGVPMSAITQPEIDEAVAS